MLVRPPYADYQQVSALMLTVGLPKEIKPHEKRVALIPEAVLKLTDAGIRVLVERGAGLGSGYEDREYEAAGASMAATAEGLYGGADLIQKVKEPQEAEFPYLRHKILFGFLHLASKDNCELLKALREGKTTALAYETLEVGGAIPVLKPMSEIAGGLSVIYAALFLKWNPLRTASLVYPNHFMDVLSMAARAYPEPPPELSLGEVVVIGGGVAGQQAARTALKMNASVLLIEKDALRRKHLQETWGESGGRFSVAEPKGDWLERLASADVLIGCAHRAGYRAEQVLEGKQLRRISHTKRKFIVDIAVDQGGNFPETRVTSYNVPLFIDSLGNHRLCIPNLPSYCGPLASKAITETTLKYTLAMAGHWDRAAAEYPELKTAFNLIKGKVVHKGVRKAHCL